MKLSCLCCRFSDLLPDDSLWCEATRFFDKGEYVREIVDLPDNDSIPEWCPIYKEYHGRQF